jgi:hypothetical protein
MRRVVAEHSLTADHDRRPDLSFPMRTSLVRFARLVSRGPRGVNSAGTFDARDAPRQRAVTVEHTGGDTRRLGSRSSRPDEVQRRSRGSHNADGPTRRHNSNFGSREREAFDDSAATSRFRRDTRPPRDERRGPPHRTEREQTSPPPKTSVSAPTFDHELSYAVYADRGLVVLDKPAGLICQGATEEDRRVCSVL